MVPRAIAPPIAAQSFNRDGRTAETSSSSPLLSALRRLAIPLLHSSFASPGVYIDNVKFERIRGHEQRPTSTCGRWRRSPWQNSQANLNNSGVKWDGLHPYNAGSLLRSVDTAPNLGKGGSRDVEVSSARCCTRLSPTLRARPLGQSSVRRNLVASNSEVGTLSRWDSELCRANAKQTQSPTPKASSRESRATMP